MDAKISLNQGVFLQQHIERIKVAKLLEGLVKAAAHSGTVDSENFHLSVGAGEVVNVFFRVDTVCTFIYFLAEGAVSVEKVHVVKSLLQRVLWILLCILKYFQYTLRQQALLHKTSPI